MLHLRSTLLCCVFLFGIGQLCAQCPISVNAGEDVYRCTPPGPAQLNGDIGGDYLSFSWNPTNGMSGSGTLSPTVNVSQTTNYVLTGVAADFSNNLISNGDFESGNSNFTSDYIYNPGDLVPEGYYDVIDNPQSDHPGFAPCVDHTSGTGNMMVVNGAGTPNQNVWCQTVPVMPNTPYVFSAWVTSVVASSPALLQFNINGTPLGPIFQAPGSTCNWQNYFQLWNSGTNTSATICIVNQNTTLGGNDFALDDIFFNATCNVTDTVTVHVVSVTAVAAPTVVTLPCEGATIQLSGNGSSTGPNIVYEWSTVNGNIVSGETTLTPTVDAPGEYTLSVIYEVNGEVICLKTATVNVVLNPNPLAAWVNPPQPLGCGAPTTVLFGNSNQAAFSSYQWSTLDGNIIGNPDQKNITVNQVGTYSLLVTNINTGCTATAEVTVTLTNNVPVANASSNGLITCANDSVPLLGTGSSSGANIIYSWTTITGQITGSTSTQNTIAGTGGLYILHVTNTSNNCTSNDTVTVPANVTPPTVVGTLPPQLSCDPNQDTISIFINVGPPPFVLINWTTADGNIVSGQYTPAPQADEPGTYTVSVFDPANGCYNFDTSQVLANFTIPIANILPSDTITCQSPSIQLQGSGSSTGPNFSINWTASNGGNIVSGGNTLTPTVNSAGDYLLILQDSVSLCADTAMVSVQADTNVVVAIANAPDTLSCVVNSVTLNADGSSTNGTLTYFWSTMGGNISGGQNTPNPTVTAAGTYQLLLTNTANGCSATDLATVELNTTTPPISIAAPDTLTCAVPSQVIQGLNASSGIFSYQWSAANGGNITAGDSTLTPTVNQPGTYTLVATNLNNGCTASASVSVALEAGVPVVVTATPGPLTCATLTQTLNTTGSSTGANFNYSWTTPDGNIDTGANTPNPTVTAPGTYTLQITNTANGCSSTASVVVLQDTLAPTAVVLSAADTLNCLTSQLELIGDGTGNGVWTSTNGNILFTMGFVAQIDAPGMYVFTTTNPNNGCTSLDSVEIFENVQIPSATILPPAILTCIVQNVTINTTTSGQSLQFDWQTANGNIVSGQSSSAISVNEPGDYTLVVTNGINGCSTIATTSVAQDTIAPNIQILPPPTITCDAPTVVVQGQNNSVPGPGYSYTWTASGGATILTGAGSLAPTIGSGGVVTFACFNFINGCESIVSDTVPQNTVFPTADAGANDTLSCLTNALTINGSGAGATTLDFIWQASAGGQIVSGGNTPTPVVDQPGVYTLTVENPANGCTATDMVQVFNDANAPSANAGTAATLTCTLLQTNLSATASTGNNISYNWTASSGGNISSGQNTLTPTVTEPGVYTLAVTNANNGCVATSSVTVPENVVPPVVDAGASATLTCTITNLNLNGTASGGAASYAWTTSNGNILSGGNTLTPTINQTGTYTFSATLNSNGCSASDLVTVGIDTLAPAFQIQAPNLLTCTQLNTALNGSVQQPGAGNFSANWTTTNGNFIGSQNTLNTSVDAPGLYTLNIQNLLNGCDASQQITVNQDTTAPTALAAPGGDLTCVLTTVTLNGNGSSLGNNFTYNWIATAGGNIVSNGNTLAPTVNSAGIYTLQVSNITNGCTATTSTPVGNNTTPPIVAISQPTNLTCVQNEVTLDGTGSSQGPNITASWATSAGNIVSGQGTFEIVVNEVGNYILTVLNQQNGCTETAQVLVQENTATPGALVLPAPALHCNLTQISLVGSSPTIGALNYAWTAANGGHIVSGDTSPTPQVDEPGAYTLLVTNPDNGCTSSTTLTVGAIPDPSFNPSLTQPNCFVPTGSVNFGPVSGGQAPFLYSNDGGQNSGTQTLFNSLVPGNYPLVVSDANGCTASEVITIDEPFLPSLDIADIQKIEQGDSILLSPSTNIPLNQIASWQWSPADGLSCADCAEPWANPLRSQYYTVTVEDLDGCKAEERILVQVSRKRHIYPPTVFSPNDDGENDRFTLYTKGVREIRRLAIFDRWGEEVFLRKNFQPNDDSLGWDGTFRGSPMTPAVFVWAAEVEFIDGEIEVIFGDVTVVR